MEFSRPSRIDGGHWSAIATHAARVGNQLPSDHAGEIGACKDLVECVAKVVLAEATSPEIDDFPKLVRKASTVLGSSTPHTDGGAQAGTLAKGLAMAVGAHETAAQGLGEFRNGHGSGHGRPTMPAIADEDVRLVLAYTQAWVSWALSRLERLLANSVSTLIAELTGSTFRQGMLRERMTEVGFEQVGEEEQERLGFAVAERGVRRETFVVAAGGVSPLVHDAAWPPAYQFGIAKGLLLTAEGTLLPLRLDVLAAVLPRLGTDLQARLLDEVEFAMMSSAIAADEATLMGTWTALVAMESSLHESLRARWSALAERFLVAS